RLFSSGSERAVYTRYDGITALSVTCCLASAVASESRASASEAASLFGTCCFLSGEPLWLLVAVLPAPSVPTLEPLGPSLVLPSWPEPANEFGCQTCPSLRL